MLQVKVIRDEKNRVRNGLKKRGWSATQLKVLDQILQQDDARKAAQKELDDCLAEQNRLSKEIGKRMGEGKKDEAEAMKTRVAELKEQSGNWDKKKTAAEENLEDLLLSVPNVPYKQVPAGQSADDNEVFKNWEKPFPTLAPDAVPHWDLAKKYNLFDLELGVKLTGSGFPVYRGKGAKLQRALINFFLDEASKAGFEEIEPPFMVN